MASEAATWAPPVRQTPGLEPGYHVDLLYAALLSEAEAQRRLLAGDPAAAMPAFRAAAAAYRASWETSPPRSFGRLVGMLKASVIAGDAEAAARYAAAALAEGCDSPASCYARAVAALVLGDDHTAIASCEGMRAGGEAFGRAADGVTAIAQGDPAGLTAAVRAIVDDFTVRTEHVTGVPIADTALMLDALAARRGMTAASPASHLLPPREP